MKICRITKKSLGLMDGILPEIAKKRYWDPGCFTIGAVTEDEEKGRASLVGVCQFVIGSTKKGNVFAVVTYVYVYSDYRRLGVGRALMDKACSILREVGVSYCLSILLEDEAETLGYRIATEEIADFLEMQGFVHSKEAYTSWPDAVKYLFKGIPGISIKDPKWYIRRIMGV